MSGPSCCMPTSGRRGPRDRGTWRSATTSIGAAVRRISSASWSPRPAATSTASCRIAPASRLPGSSATWSQPTPRPHDPPRARPPQHPSQRLAGPGVRAPCRSPPLASAHGPLHAEARELAQPSRARTPPHRPAGPGARPRAHPRRDGSARPRLEPPRESSAHLHHVALHPQTRARQVPIRSPDLQTVESLDPVISDVLLPFITEESNNVFYSVFFLKTLCSDEVGT